MKKQFIIYNNSQDTHGCYCGHYKHQYTVHGAFDPSIENARKVGLRIYTSRRRAENAIVVLNRKLENIDHDSLIVLEVAPE